MIPVFRLLRVAVRQSLARPRSIRVPEPATVMDDVRQVDAYDRAHESKLAAAYRAVLWFLDRLPVDFGGGVAVDVCCGPGHFACELGRLYGFRAVYGVDLSLPMLERARARAERIGLGSRVAFLRGDAMRLGDLFPEHRFRLVTCNNALHHLPDLDAVRRFLLSLSRLVEPAGVLVVSDLVRLKTPELNDEYVDVLGEDYTERGLDQLLHDFRASMHAAWTAEEIRAALPHVNGWSWMIYVPRWLPTLQVVVAHPKEMPSGQRRAGRSEKTVFEVPALEWQLLKLSLLMARRIRVAGE